MWVAQITIPATQGEHDIQCAALEQRFPVYQFSSMHSGSPFIVCKPRNPKLSQMTTQQHDALEREILQFILTSLLDELITGHMITDGQEEEAPR